jgi:nucleoside-diphosphate-sugar epimerase
LLEGMEGSLVYGDVTDPDSLDAAFEKADYVFHVAGVVKALRAETFHQVNAVGTENVCAAIERVAPTLGRLVYVSSISVAGPGEAGIPRTEADPPAPISLYGKSKAAGEQTVREAADRVPLSIVRPTIVYGPGDSSTLELFVALKRHLKVVVTGGARYYNYIYVSDLVDGILAAGHVERALGETYFITHPEYASWETFQDEILATLGTWALRVPMPAGLMPSAGRFADWVSRRRGRASIFGMDKVRDALPQQWLCSAEKARRELGFEARHGLSEGLKIQAQWLREHGLI